MIITYKNNLSTITEEMLEGFFVGWCDPPSKSAHMKILEGSYLVWLAVDTETNMVVGFINVISDGVLSAYIPLLEVVPEYQNMGIGKELINRTLDSLKNLYMIDLLCDENLQEYYEKFDMHKTNGMMIRNYKNQNGEAHE